MKSSNYKAVKHLSVNECGVFQGKDSLAPLITFHTVVIAALL